MLSHSPLPRSSQRTTEQPHAVPSRRWRAPVEDEVGVWPITFSDLVLLLLCFFVLWHVAEKRYSLSALPVKSTSRFSLISRLLFRFLRRKDRR
jgi:hypothetical protein